ncbi:sensor histidine kinase [Variovorax sp. OV329]|uniref:sensor histidine kinase n=1 Tax=Variovorax sp. OV329 TaxID=1882825 RepID=UPI0008E7A6CE|nr:histidine kinase [Variovorax sp. OV329]SFM10055.1 two-component system, LytT family, sensor histidine kinase AlgZ [Variovorax sp. OV329]
MRNLSILSAVRLRPPASQDEGQAATATPPTPPAVFDVCQVGVVLRAVLFVQAVLAVLALFVATGPADWLGQVATLTGGALPAVLLWLVAVCALHRRMARWRPAMQYGTGAVLGALAGLYGCGLLRVTGALAVAPWVASALGGVLFSAVAMGWLVLRASSRMPAATAAKLEDLQSRIRPHFLFNTLNSAIALVREEPAKAETLLEDLAELFRQALADPRDSVTLADEIGLAERYLAIEQVRFGDRLRIRWDLDAAASSARLPPLLLQPLVENAVKHGVEPSPKGGKLRIRTERRGARVVIEVTNTLPPLRWAEQPLPRGHGIALANVRDRLRLLHDVQAQFRAGVDQDNYRVRIDIPAPNRE